jgi:hypothetical protein
LAIARYFFALSHLGDLPNSSPLIERERWYGALAIAEEGRFKKNKALA